MSPIYHPANGTKLFTDRELAGPALRAFFNITEKWKLSDQERMQLLGNPGRTTFYQWKRTEDGALAKDTLERISYVLGIYKALHLIFANDEAADAWIKKPNDAPLFNGMSALSRMLSGNVVDLYLVRQYLDAVRGGFA